LVSCLRRTVAPKSSGGGASRPFIVILQQIKHGNEEGHDTPVLLEWPRAVHDVQDDVWLGARLEVVVPLKLTVPAFRDVRLEVPGGNNLQSMLRRRTEATPDDI